MDNQVIRTIRLSGEDAIFFANSLFRPTREEIEHYNELIRRIDENIKIERCSDGFEAEIADLDLSFLDEIQSEKKMNVEVRFELKTMAETFYNSESHTLNETVVVEKNNNYSSSGNNDMLIWAA
ncbi:MAG: hypothetical protein MSA21_10660 [Lachnospiraceae bacterium]|nr:hypothetical protein [Lachnospiraceae bacterium]